LESCWLIVPIRPRHTRGRCRGFLAADSADFTLDPRGRHRSCGILLADSGFFELDTRDALDIGLRVYDRLAVIKIGVEAPAPAGQLASALRIGKNGKTTAFSLSQPGARPSRVRMQTAAGPKAWRKVP